MAAGAAAKPRWLNAVYDPLANLCVPSNSCVDGLDLKGDSDYRLIAACEDKKLRVLNARMVMERVVNLIDTPTACCAFRTDESPGTTPAVAIASGSFVFVYRNLKPFFKF